MNNFKRGLKVKESLQIGSHRIKIIADSFKGYNYIKFPFHVKSIEDEHGNDLMEYFHAPLFIPDDISKIKTLLVNNQYKYFGAEQAGNVCYDSSGNNSHAIRC